VLSDVLRAVRLTGAVYFDFNLTAPWIVEAPASRDIVDRVMPGAERVIEYHLIASGDCWGSAVGQAPRRLREGDLIVFPQGNPHVLSSAPGRRAAVDMTVFTGETPPLPIVYEAGGGGEKTRVLCCFLGCDDRPYNPLLGALPDVIHVSSRDSQSAAGWLATLMTMAVKEMTGERPGGGNVLSRLSELMFVETIRAHLAALPGAHTGWLAGLADPIVSRALGALHAEPHNSWTVERLASAAGVSRSALAERFMAVIGQPPMQYLAAWRMQLASRMLRDGAPVATAAAAVGYESEASFSRAFKRLAGVPPGAWRQPRPSRLRSK
jgi:AraC-like DNA-binding protein